ncbi:LysR family transcriptional regulator [Rothia halotolerans]|uniref:LysR family transcriptional regulator n=1 Tax=Rothia halotolerans TaxID=405770 RepID=UPI00101BC6DA|nr:LysR family transcriptional regulator [Rothia halotolerans]
MLNLQRLRMLRELYRLGTLAEVARTLSYTPSAVSQQLGLLEREAGVQLLQRVGRGVRLTDDAVTLVEHTEALLARLELAEAELATSQEKVSGVLRMASFQSALLTIAPTALTLLEQRHPELQVQIAEREVGPAYEGLLSHEFDVILGEEYPGLPDPIHPGVDRVDLVTDPLHLVLPTEGRLAEPPRYLSDLAEAPWAVDPPDAASGRWARAMCRGVGFEPRAHFDTLNPLLQAQLVRTGHAVAFIPALIAVQHLEGTRLVALPGDPRRKLFTAVRSGRAQHPAVLACRAAFAESAARERAPRPAWRLEGLKAGG